MSAVCHIVCGGPCGVLEVELGFGDLLIAADAGFAHCVGAGLSPDLFIGDMDSLPAGLVDTIECERIELPCEKDDTDTLAACKVGLERGYAEFILYAALGGDVGHEIANIQTLAYLHAQGARGVLLGESQAVHLITPDASTAVFKADTGTRVSVFAYGGPSRGVCIRGLHWELEDATLESHLPVGVSNRVECGDFEISVREGMLLVVIG